MDFVLPPLPTSRRWRVELDTSREPGRRSGSGRRKAELHAGSSIRAQPARSIVMLMEVGARWRFRHASAIAARLQGE